MMDITVEKYGKYRSEDLYEIILINNKGTIVKLLNYGATLEKVLLQTVDGTQNMILSLPNREDYTKKRNYLGGTVGRVVGRIRGHVWTHGHTQTVLPMNEGHNHTHGGNDGLDRQVYQFQLEQSSEAVAVKFTFVDPNQHNDYPGNLKLCVSYTLDNNNILCYQVQAKSDAETLFNPTNHTYFALDQPNSIDQTNMTIPANYYQSLDAEHLPNNGWKPVANKVFDFNQERFLGSVIHDSDPQIQAEHGLNHPFLLKQGQRLAAKLETNQHIMIMKTTAPSIVVYTANHFKGKGIAHNIHQFAGVALECQFQPVGDSNLSAITLFPNECFELTTTWTFQ